MSKSRYIGGFTCGHTPAQRLFAAGDDGLPHAAGPRGACCQRVCARAGAGSRRIVLRWGARVVGGLWRRGEGAVAWCLLTPSSRAAARKRALGRLHEVFSRTNGGMFAFRAPEPSPSCSPPVSLAQAKLTVPFWRYRPATARCFWCLSTRSSRELLSALLLVVVVAGLSGCYSCMGGVEKARGKR